MTPTQKKLLDDLRALVGGSNVIAGGDLEAWEMDWNRRARGKALAVVRPGSAAEVAAVVRRCAQARTGVVPQGGNTGLVLGGIPDASGTQIVLSLARMDRILEIDPVNMTATVQAGCILRTLQDRAREQGLLFPLSLAAEGSCTVGGNLATNAGGTQVIRYGNAGDLCLGVECVTAQGELIDGLTALRKDNTGYDLKRLLIGSEGTLGVITAATVKLYPQPASQHTAWIALEGLEQALALLRKAHRALGPGLTGFEVMNAVALNQVARHFPVIPVPFLQERRPPWCALLEFSAAGSEGPARQQFEAMLAAAMEAGHAQDAVVAASLEQRERLWAIREHIPLAQASEGLNIKHDVSVPVSRVADFIQATHARLEQAVPGVRFVTFGHLGDGNVHYNVQAPSGADPDVFRRDYEKRINAIVYRSVAEHAGSFSAEHGVGVLRREQLAATKPEAALALMRAMKRALDPLGILNPGKVVDGDAA